MNPRPLAINCTGFRYGRDGLLLERTGRGPVPLVPIPELDRWWEQHWRKQARQKRRDCRECAAHSVCQRVFAQMQAAMNPDLGGTEPGR